jgi:hypothetical protein
MVEMSQNGWNSRSCLEHEKKEAMHCEKQKKLGVWMYNTGISLDHFYRRKKETSL